MAALALPLVQPAVTGRKLGRWLQVLSHLHPKYGGLSSVVPALITHFPSSADLDLAAFCNPGESITPAGFSSANLSFWPASRKAWLTDGDLRYDYTRRLSSYDGLHIHGLWEASTATSARTARSMRIPYVISAHGMLEPWALASGRLKKLLYAAMIERANVAKAACLHALTAAEAEQYLQFGGRSPIAIISNAVEIPGGRPEARSLFLNTFPTLRGKRIVLYLARLHPKKGLDLLLRSWQALSSRFPGCTLVLAGPDTEGTRARLEHFVATHNLGASVLFTGMLTSRLKWGALVAADCFVLPSHSEGLPVGVLEAMGAGLPVIVTRACNMPQVVEHNAGWQIEPVQDQLTTALAACLDNTGQQNSLLGSRGADLISRQYSWPTVTARMAAVYRWVETRGPLPTSVDWVLP